ncbi:RNase H family protein [Vagococcus xieshaowenii]|uniref:RNase H family protein n=1 Tax=Vagococcus xieshaowenii TaxID=2562451 RepID=UPI0014327E68|nr:RNase H family protein [Vagococcus xieshaowenii]
MYTSCGIVLQSGQHRKTYAKVTPGVSLQVGLLEGVATALGMIQHPHRPVQLYTSMSYLYHALTKGYLEEWAQQQWLTKQNKPVKNQKEWRDLRHELKRFDDVRCRLISGKSQAFNARYSKYLAKQALYTQVPFEGEL